MSQMMPREATGVPADLYKHLAELLYSIPGDDRQRAYWVMSTEWRDKVADYAKRVLRQPEPAHWTELLGLPFKVDDTQGFPALVIPDADDDLATLNAARRWWLDHMPGPGERAPGSPTDAEVLEAYGRR